MGPQRYAAVNQADHDHDNYENESPLTPTAPQDGTPSSPPPSFRSRTSSPSSRRLLREDPITHDREHELNDAFGSDDDSDNEDGQDDRQRLMRADTSRSVSLHTPPGSPPSLATSGTLQPPRIERRVTEIPSFRPPQSTSNTASRQIQSASDGVFANLSAKPTAGESLDDKPPTYEQAAADATPPYWETTILAPGMNSDEVYINGLPVGSVFSFIWNGMISMSFLLPGFLLTYLLHTTHAAKNGSLAGLGLTLVQYGFYMRGGSNNSSPDSADPAKFAGGGGDPNAHDFDPNNPTGDPNNPAGNGGAGSNGVGSADFLSYGLMIVGWFILIRAVSGFLRARREEQLVLQSPARGLGVAVVAEGEGERAV